MEKSASLKEAQYYFREAEQFVRDTRERAEVEGFILPPDFAHDARWWMAEAEIEAAIAKDDLPKTRELSQVYIKRVMSYCLGWLQNQRKRKGAAA